jgi:hypothetical protein
MWFEKLLLRSINLKANKIKPEEQEIPSESPKKTNMLFFTKVIFLVRFLENIIFLNAEKIKM